MWSKQQLSIPCSARALSQRPSAKVARSRWVLGVCMLVFAAGALASVRAPTIRLFPTTVLEDIKQTGNAALEMETGLQDVIARLDQQQQLFRESKCDGAESDPGCARIVKQLGATYLEMLDTMADKLPTMEEAVSNTHFSLEKRLRSELGQKMTPWTLQEMLLGKAAQEQEAIQPALRGRSGMRLSDRFQQYYQLVSHSRSAGGHSLAVIASDIYLDMKEAADLIARTREEISRATLMEQLNQSFGIVTPKMQQVVADVKTILFGELDTHPPVASPPRASTEQEYRSPLEL